MMRTIFLVCLVALASARTAPENAKVSAPADKKYGDAGAFIQDLECHVDPKINASTIDLFCKKDATGQLQRKLGYYNLFEDECGRNRGIFIEKDSSGAWDGHTYDCGNLPLSWPTVEGVNNTLEKTVCENDFASPEDRVQVLENFIGAEWAVTITENEDTCDFGTMSLLKCPTVGRNAPVWQQPGQFPWSDKIKGAPIRAVNIGGLFVLEAWITPGFYNWTAEIPDQYNFCKKEPAAKDMLKKHWDSFYTADDFKQMAAMNLNSVRLPVGWWYFASDPSPYIIPEEDLTSMDHPITRVIGWAKDAGLQVLLDLHAAPGSQNGFDNSGIKSLDPVVERWGETWLYSKDNLDHTIEINLAMAKYIKDLEGMGLDNILGLELVNEPGVFLDMSRVRDFFYNAVEAVRALHPDLPLFIHDAFRHQEWQWLLKDFPSHNVFLDTHLYHAFDFADIASDNPRLDALKQLAHEDISCRYGNLLRWKSCTGVPAITGEWSLATDDCMGLIRSAVKSGNGSQVSDFGQCKNLAARFNFTNSSNSAPPPGGYTVNATWWQEHIKSFAMRQISMFEREIGWAFWTWHVDEVGEQDPSAKLWSFKLAVEAGFIDTNFPTNACERIPDYTGYENTKKDPTPSPGLRGELPLSKQYKNIDFARYKMQHRV